MRGLGSWEGRSEWDDGIQAGGGGEGTRRMLGCG